jgi:pre-mRNA-splicing factor ISY1
LHRFRAARAEELGHARILDTRPKMTTEVTKLADCERWRHEVIREISQGVSKIQNRKLINF